MRFSIPMIFVGLVVAVGIGTYFMLGLDEPPARTDLPIGAKIAIAGEWVTNPDGSRVCKLTSPVMVGMQMGAVSCSEWVSEKPAVGQLVPWLRSNRGYGQINVEGRWRP